VTFACMIVMEKSGVRRTFGVVRREGKGVGVGQEDGGTGLISLRMRNHVFAEYVTRMH
jgi:hypothetical protein